MPLELFCQSIDLGLSLFSSSTKTTKKKSKKKKKSLGSARIVALDGGGIKGLVSAVAVREVERLSGKAIGSCADLLSKRNLSLN